MQTNGTTAVNLNPMQASVVMSLMRVMANLNLEAFQLESTYQQKEAAEFLRNLVTHIGQYSDGFVAAQGHRVIVPQTVLPDLKLK